MLTTMILLAAAAPGPAATPGKCVKDEDTKRFATMEYERAYLLADKPVVRPGDTIALTASWRDGPFGVKQIPLACLKNWQVDPKQATLSKDRRTLRIADDVAAGSEVAVGAVFGRKSVRGFFKITGRDEKVLTGKWSQAAATGCGANARRVAELVFGDGGRYSYTFPEMMVETMTSGGGTYRWDAAAGTLDLNGTKATATLVGDELTITGMKFDSSQPPEITGFDPKTGPPILAPEQVCRITFRAIGAR